MIGAVNVSEISSSFTGRRPVVLPAANQPIKLIGGRGEAAGLLAALRALVSECDPRERDVTPRHSRMFDTLARLFI